MSASSLVATLLHADPAFAAGAGSFSSGLERLVADQLVTGSEVAGVISELLELRWNQFDRVFLVRSVGVVDDLDRLLDIDSEVERHLFGAAARESSRRAGSALLGSWARLDDQHASRLRSAAPFGVHLPVAQAVVGVSNGLTIDQIEALSCWSLASAQVSAAVRLGVIGHRSAQRILIDCSRLLTRLLAVPVTGDALPGSWSPLLDIAAERHRDSDLKLFAS